MPLHPAVQQAFSQRGFNTYLCDCNHAQEALATTRQEEPRPCLDSKLWRMICSLLHGDILMNSRRPQSP